MPWDERGLMGRGDDDRDRRLTYGWWWWWWGDDVDDDAGEVTEVEDEKDEQLGLSALVEHALPPSRRRTTGRRRRRARTKRMRMRTRRRGLVESAPTAAPACRWSSQRCSWAELEGAPTGGSRLGHHRRHHLRID